MAAVIYLPKILRIGAGASAELPGVLRELGVTSPLIVTDSYMKQSGYLQRLQDILATANITCGVFDRSVPDPTTDSVYEGLEVWRQHQADGVVALGGGSSIDTAKAIAVLARHGGLMRDYKVPHPVPQGLPVIAIPTTAGTGSEVTCATVVTDTETQEKMLCMGLGMQPSAALVDYELTLTMPFRLTADTGLDSLCHAMEAYVSRKANPFTDSVALSAMQLIATHIRTACEQPDNRIAREAMMLAATQGGIAFSNASVTLIHGMSRPIGAFFHVPHGLSNAMLMTAVTEYSLPGATSRYADCAKAMGFAGAGDSDVVAGDKLIVGLSQLSQDLKVPDPKAYGIDEVKYRQHIEIMAAQALASGSPNNNPLVPTQGDIEQLYERVYQRV